LPRAELSGQVRRLSGVYRLLTLGLLVAASGCSLSGSGEHMTTSIQSRVVPRAPLAQSACVKEMRGFGWALGAARPACTPSRTAPWFHATITNESAPATYVRCAFTAWDKNSQQVFFGYLPLTVMGFPAGMYLERHQTRSIDCSLTRETSRKPPAMRTKWRATPLSARLGRTADLIRRKSGTRSTVSFQPAHVGRLPRRDPSSR
jgi:hypothetical protein